MATKLQLIASILENLKYDNSIPIASSVDINISKELAESYTHKIVKADIVSNIITDIAFERQLNNRVHPDYKTVKFEGALLNDILKEINSEISSLPKKYEFIFRLPHTDTPIKSIKLRNNIEILTLGSESGAYQPKPQPTSKASKLSDLTRLVGSLSSAINQARLTLESSDTILRINVSGYVAKYGEIHLTTDDPLYIYKVIMGFYLNQKIFISKPTLDYYNKAPLNYSYSIIDKLTSNVVRSFDGDTQDGIISSRRQYDPSAFKPTSLQKALSITDAPIDTAHKELKKLFSKMTGDGMPEWLPKQQRRLKNGLYWYYEARKAPQNFLIVTSVISSLDALASSDQSAKEAKADSISQAISKNIVSEKDIREEIIKLYALRNSIVHGEMAVSALDDYTVNGRKNSTIAYAGLRISSLYLNYRIQKYTSLPWK